MNQYKNIEQLRTNEIKDLENFFDYDSGGRVQDTAETRRTADGINKILSFNTNQFLCFYLSADDIFNHEPHNPTPQHRAREEKPSYTYDSVTAPKY